ncbi:MAG: CDP-2,3-bis-(O-geranylgeranyl)-sn-glycerol synthase [Candidatus Thermoplasmatota archaeon]
MLSYTLIIVLQSLWLMLPAYIANSSAVIFGGGKPIDFGRSIKGERILGDGKTWLGLIGGIVSGTFIGSIQVLSLNYYPNELFPNFYPYDNRSSISYISLLIIFTFGALFGDIVKSFFKRRAGIERGAKLPIIDQLDFVLGALLFSYIFFDSWFIKNFTAYHIISIIIITPFLHKAVNIIGYKIGKKTVPW